MRTITKKETLYTFDELHPQAQEKAIQAERDSLMEEYKPDYLRAITNEEAINWEEDTGIPIDKYDIVYILGKPQEAGLSFTTRVDEYIDIEQLFHYYTAQGRRERKRIKDIEKQPEYWYVLNNYRFIISRDTYYRINKSTVSCEYWDKFYSDRGSQVAEKISQIINEIKDMICQGIYGRLQAAREYMTDPDTIAEKLETNGYEFTEDGTMI